VFKKHFLLLSTLSGYLPNFLYFKAIRLYCAWMKKSDEKFFLLLKAINFAALFKKSGTSKK